MAESSFSVLCLFEFLKNGGVEMQIQSKIQRLAASAVLLAMCIVLPFITGQIPEIGNMLCPMHIPVLLCGFLCGWQYGAVTGFIAPLLRSFLFASPPLFPQAVSMAFELLTYGMVSGLLSKKLPDKSFYVYFNLIISMFSGRIVWGLVRFIIQGIGYTDFSFSLFIAGAFSNAVPGILIQLIVVPIVVIALRRSNLWKD